jgi:DNA-cytosine methyltransferase
MIVLSLFDGMSANQQALKELGVYVEKYLASEIDPFAIKITQKNFPNTIQLGDVCNVSIADHIDLIVAGSPCQDLSFAGKGKGLDGERSGLFFEAIRIIKEAKAINPNVKVLIENVKMKQEHMDTMSDALSEALEERVTPQLLNSGLVSAQNRQRLYWYNWETIEEPEDKGLVLKDILETTVDDKYLAGQKLLDNYVGGDQLNPSYKSQANTIHDHNKKSPTICAGTHGYAIGYVDGNYFKYGEMEEIFDKEFKLSRDGLCHIGNAKLSGNQTIKRVYHSEGKAPTLTTMGGGHREPKVYTGDMKFRKLTPLECERLQTFPDGYTEGVSNTQRYKMLGNSFTVEMIKCILSPIVKELEDGESDINNAYGYHNATIDPRNIEE